MVGAVDVELGNLRLKGVSRETMLKPNPEPKVDPNVQVAAAIQRMIDLLAHVVEQQGHNPNPLVGNPGNPRNHIESEGQTVRGSKNSPHQSF